VISHNSAQLLFSLDFPMDKRITIHIYVVLTFLISTNGNLTYVHFSFFLFFIIYALIANAFASNVLNRLCHACVGPMMHNDQQPNSGVSLDTTLQMIKHVSKFCQVMLVYRYVHRKERMCCDMLRETPTK